MTYRSTISRTAFPRHEIAQAGKEHPEAAKLEKQRTHEPKAKDFELKVLFIPSMKKKGKKVTIILFLYIFFSTEGENSAKKEEGGQNDEAAPNSLHTP